jgi:hypothetical protein
MKILRSTLTLLFFLLIPNHAEISAPDRTTMITFFNEAILSSAAAFAKDPTIKPLSPPEHEEMLKSIQTSIRKSGDPELIKLFLQYQVAYLNPDNDRPARLIGEIFLDQPKAFQEGFELLSPNHRLMVFPYFKFGWMKAIEGKNTSLPSVAEKQKRFDRIAQGLINLRGYQDQPE